MAKGDSRRGKTPLLEWFAAVTGLLLILSVVAVIGREAIREPAADTPAIAIQVGAIGQVADGFVVAFEALNQANGTAVAVEIEGTLMSGSSLVERSVATIDYVPGHGRTSGGLFFSKDPRKNRLIVRATGFQDP
ncbi:hypothetical protein [Sphingobium psychrophilum]|jgi:uncharacterized protein (TIGR02588 family)|uniref:hypothetical protein n=1 Tax=Sphingobium psychrophilum TaxID=2728834 RepID=UPI00146C18DE|nr:hypothetical protein [Sphingobium psychrophilum]